MIFSRPILNKKLNRQIHDQVNQVERVCSLAAYLHV